jgi:hypothetical protein
VGPQKASAPDLLDLSASFPTTDHSTPHHFYFWFGISGNTVYLIKSDLISRSVEVIIAIFHSFPLPVLSGVPQGCPG